MSIFRSGYEVTGRKTKEGSWAQLLVKKYLQDIHKVSTGLIRPSRGKILEFLQQIQKEVFKAIEDDEAVVLVAISVIYSRAIRHIARMHT